MTVTVLAIDTIVADPRIRGGRPSIAGRSICVSDLVIGYLYKKYTPEELAVHYDLALGQVHAALAFYYMHQAEIDDQLRRDEAQTERLLAELEQQGKLIRLE
jgi:uncharacterized protein (DUF433 family)